MVNLSPSALLTAAGAGAAFIGLLVAPPARADADPAYGDLSTLYGDVTVFENSYGLFEDSVFYSDLTSLGNIITASGINIGDSFSSAATASADLSSIAAQDNTLASQLAGIQQTIASEPAVSATIGARELPVITKTLTFQDQLNTDIANLPTVTTEDETNPLVISDLSALYGREVNFSNELLNLRDSLSADDPAGVTADNASILSEGFGTTLDAQSTADVLTLLADLTNLGL